MVIRKVTENITTLSVPFARFGRMKIGGRATLGIEQRLPPPAWSNTSQFVYPLALLRASPLSPSPTKSALLSRRWAP